MEPFEVGSNPQGPFPLSDCDREINRTQLFATSQSQSLNGN